MSNARGKRRRISNLEERILAPICNCRIATALHNAECLRTILDVRSVPCPAHGFRSLGVFFLVPPHEPVLPSDQQFCSCSATEESETRKNVDSNLDWEDLDFGVELRLARQYLQTPVKHIGLDVPFAAIASNVIRRREDGTSYFEGLTDDTRAILIIAMDYCLKREKWMIDTGRRLPKWTDILTVLAQRGRYV